MKRLVGLSIVTAAGLLVLLPLLYPLITGQELFLRDIGTTHRPAWSAFRGIGFAKINPAASFGQPYRGNPNLLIWYPFPKSRNSIEAHVGVHLALLFIGVFAWLLERTKRPTAAIAGALCFTLSGYVLSMTSSINALTSIAWIPWILLIAEHAAVTMTARMAAVRTTVLALFSLSGEPVFIVATLLLALGLAWRRGRLRGIGGLVIPGSLALAITFPLHRETLLAALESSRVVHGFSFAQAASYSLHPVRLIEELVPGFFGNPSHLLVGTWWGYAVSRNALPSVWSITTGVVALAILCAYGALTRFREHRPWWILLVVTAIVSFGGYLPGSERLWPLLPLLHVVRFPIKAFLFATLCVSVLVAHGFAYLNGLPARSPARGHVAFSMASAALVSLAGALAAGLHGDAITRWIERAFSDPRWREPPAVVLAPLQTLVVTRLSEAAVLCSLLFFWIVRRRTIVFDAVIAAAIALELIVAGADLMPKITRSRQTDVSPLLNAARSVHGRVFERAAKDLDAPVDGLMGHYGADDSSQLAIAQSRQAWALYGSIYGVQYAYDRSPDGSYTWRNQLVEEWLEGMPWPQRIRWLRGVAVAAVIASDVPAGMPGLRTVAQEASIGIPATLSLIEPRLSELRVPPKIVWVRTPEAAFASFTSGAFDEQSTVMVEGSGRIAQNGAAVVEMIRNEADRVIFRSTASSAAFVFLARSYTRQVRASTAQRDLRVYPANVHLCAIEVPAGTNEIAVSF